MKPRLKQAQGILALNRPQVSLTLTESTDVLALIVGRQAMYGEKPAQTLANLGLKNSASVLKYWHFLKLIRGSPLAWKLDPTLLQTIRQNFGASLGSLSAGPKDEVRLYTLVGAYKKHLKKVKRKGIQSGNIAARLRLLCRKYPPALIAEKIEAFFSNRTWPDYSLDQFERYLKSKG